jgi:hypothetical protein
VVKNFAIKEQSKMKKFFAVLIVCTLAFAACDNGTGNGNTTTLRIKNESFIEITEVVWNNVAFADNQASIKTGTNVTKNVVSGSGYIYFKQKGSPIAVRTNDLIVTEANNENEFVLQNNTLVAEVSNPGNTDTVGIFFTRPWIFLKQNTATVDLYGEYNFENVVVGETKDSTFTIENIGGGNLVFETINDSRVNLGDNITGYFSIIQQPLAASVAPGNTTTFTIRFSPAAIGSDFSASVHIKSNSQNAQEFAFRIKGTGYVKRPQITVKQDTTTVSSSGEYNLGAILYGTTKDITFTIGNSGEADLNFITVSGSQVNLEGNTSGYFSVIQQPFSTTVVNPGGTTTFIIRFSPTAIGNNYTASVHISTNSQYDNDFSFWIKGNCRNYQIGDTGPGGGMIFFASGGQYKECSGELGTYNWNDAMQTAQNHNGGGFTDWYLPDIGELNLMYQNLRSNGLGGFGFVYYWSSTEAAGNYTWYATRVHFSTGSEIGSDKSLINRVRAVRSFSN